MKKRSGSLLILSKYLFPCVIKTESEKGGKIELIERENVKKMIRTEFVSGPGRVVVFLLIMSFRSWP